MKVYFIKEGNYKTNWRIKQLISFVKDETLHEHMKEKFGVEFKHTPDQYSQTRYLNDTIKYGYDVYEVEVVEPSEKAVDVPTEFVKVNDEYEVKLEHSPNVFKNMSDDALKQFAKEKGIKSWHLKSRDTLIDELTELETTE